MQLEVAYRSAQEIYGIWGPVVLRIIDGATTEPADIDRLHALLEQALREWPTVGMLLISHHGSPNPSLTTMRYSANVMAEIQDRMVVGVAPLGLGFWAETSRATVSVLMQLVRSTVTLGSSTEAVARKLALELVGIDPDGLAAACELLEREFREG